MTTFSHTFLIMVKTMTYKNKLSHTLVNKNDNGNQDSTLS